MQTRMLDHPTALTALCVFTSLAGFWLGGMDAIAHNPGWQSREWIAALIVGQGAATIAMLHSPGLRAFRALPLAGSVAIVALAVTAWRAALGSRDVEGYVLLLSLCLIVQAVLTIPMLLRHAVPRHRSA